MRIVPSGLARRHQTVVVFAFMSILSTGASRRTRAKGRQAALFASARAAVVTPSARRTTRSPARNASGQRSARIAM
jgi:hypothetical protein